MAGSGSINHAKNGRSYYSSIIFICQISHSCNPQTPSLQPAFKHSCVPISHCVPNPTGPPCSYIISSVLCVASRVLFIGSTLQMTVFPLQVLLEASPQSGLPWLSSGVGRCRWWQVGVAVEVPLSSRRAAGSSPCSLWPY